jgi:hypothetical protein
MKSRTFSKVRLPEIAPLQKQDRFMFEAVTKRASSLPTLRLFVSPSVSRTIGEPVRAGPGREQIGA